MKAITTIFYIFLRVLFNIKNIFTDAQVAEEEMELEEWMTQTSHWDICSERFTYK